MKKVLGISGSPRRGANTETLLDNALEGARAQGARIEKIILNDLRFKSCQGCRRCESTGICAIKDDMSLLYKKMDDADYIIISSPIYFASVSAQVKMMIDRFHCAWIKKYVLKKSALAKRMRKGIFLCVAGEDNNKFFTNAKEIIKAFFATLDIIYFGDIFCGGVEKKAAIRQSPRALKKAFDMGAKLVSSAYSIR